MHSVSALKQGSQRGIREVVLHFKQMNKLWHKSALLYHFIKVFVRVSNELLNRLKVSEDAVLIVVFKNSQVGFTWHQQSLFNDVDKAETKEVQRDMHEVWS